MLTGTRSLFGDVSVLALLVLQGLDGIFTYMGINVYGVEVENNPLLLQWMTMVGYGPALFGAKLYAAALGVILHLQNAHRIVAWLAAFYALVAILPWIFIFSGWM